MDNITQNLWQELHPIEVEGIHCVVVTAQKVAQGLQYQG